MPSRWKYIILINPIFISRHHLPLQIPHGCHPHLRRHDGHRFHPGTSYRGQVEMGRRRRDRIHFRLLHRSLRNVEYLHDGVTLPVCTLAQAVAPRKG